MAEKLEDSPRTEKALAALYFYEDEVCQVRKNGDIEFGTVSENWEMYSSSDDSEYEDNAGRVPNGHVAVTWHPSGKDVILPETTVSLSDRSLMPGDIVRRLIAGKDTQRGYCRKTRVSASVQIQGTKRVVVGVPSSNLKPVQKIRTDIMVYLDSWIGVVRDMKYKLSLRFPDNSSCVVESDRIADTFQDTRPSADGYRADELFYPGQKLRGQMKHLKDADWSHRSDELTRAKGKKTITVVVTNVEPDVLNVQWRWQTPSNPSTEYPPVESDKSAPPTTLKGEDMNRVACLDLFDSAGVLLGDMWFYNPSEDDVILDRRDWKKVMAESIHGVFEPKPEEAEIPASDPQPEPEIIAGDPEAETDDNPVESDALEEPISTNQLANARKETLPRVATRGLKKKKLKKTRQQAKSPVIPVIPVGPVVVEVVHTASVVEVVWQDGTVETSVPSIQLYPIHHLDDHEFFPGDFIVRAESTDVRTYGVVQSMDHSGRVALVKWFEAYSHDGEQRPRDLHVEEMSVYDIKDHPDFRFRPGTIVIRVANMTEDQKSAGQILDNCPDGQVRVWWANDVTSSCWPQDLFRLGDYDSDDDDFCDDDSSEDDDDEGVHTDSSWETETEAEEDTGIVECAFDERRSIARLLEQIQSSLVAARETSISTAPISVLNDGQVVSNTNLSESKDKRGVTKKLMLIFKDCQKLDKLMGTKFFDEDVLRDYFKQMASNLKSGQVLEQVKRFFEVSEVEGSASSSNIVEPVVASSVTETGTDDEHTEGETRVQTIFVANLCSVILNKLVKAHAEYESRFGSAADEIQDIEAENLADADEEFVDCESGETKSANEGESGQVVDESPLPPATIELQRRNSQFTLIESVPDTHRYRLTTFQPQNHRNFIKAVRAEVTKLKDHLPDGIYFKGYEDRMDLYSIMITGPENTPYEDGIFLFDIQLPPNYPDSPPLVHYVSFCPDKLNPNLYECGKVCVSLLGTWNGKGTEVWTDKSSLLQLLVSIQGLILVPEPYFNEAGYEKQRGSQQGIENSRMYNEMVLIKLVQSMSRMLANPHSPWENEITSHIQIHGPRMIQRYRDWLNISEQVGQPGFPLLPASKGFSITLKKTLDNFSKQCISSTSSSTSLGPA